MQLNYRKANEKNTSTFEELKVGTSLALCIDHCFCEFGGSKKSHFCVSLHDDLTFFVKRAFNLSKFRIDFKILLLTFKAIYGHAPGYLTDLIAIKVQTRYTLRSASDLTLNYPSVKLKKTLGDRAFSSVAPTLWNSLPLHKLPCGQF